MITYGKESVYSSLFGYRDHESKEKMTLDTKMSYSKHFEKLFRSFFLKKQHQSGLLSLHDQVVLHKKGSCYWERLYRTSIGLFVDFCLFSYWYILYNI